MSKEEIILAKNTYSCRHLYGSDRGPQDLAQLHGIGLDLINAMADVGICLQESLSADECGRLPYERSFVESCLKLRAASQKSPIRRCEMLDHKKATRVMAP